MPVLKIKKEDGTWEVVGGKSTSVNTNIIEPGEEDIPKVFFGAALPQTKDDTIMSFHYISKTEDIRGYCKTKAQGNSSMSYPKKNQTVKLYRDAACTEKLKVDFKGWGEQNKFCFKANWIDLTHARNIVSARLWGDVVKSRANYESIPELLRTSPNQGAVDGFPVKVYAGGVYQGRYTLNIPKDAWMANMDDDLNEHCILCGENYVSGCFRAEAKIDESDWSDEIHDTVPDSIKTRWNEAIRFVMNSTDEEFVSGIGNFFDLDSLIDYYLFGLITCNNDGFGKNQLYHTYDGLKWYATIYDVDNTFGTYLGSVLDYGFNRGVYEDYKNGGGNLLYIRLETLFVEEIKARYTELKNGPLSITNIINHFERFTDIAPPYLVEEDYAETTANGAFTDIPHQGVSNIQQIRDYIVNRYPYVDSYVESFGIDCELLYSLPSETTFDGTSGQVIDTGVKLFDTKKNFTIICDVTPGENTTDECIWDASHYQYNGENNIYYGARMARYKWTGNGIVVYGCDGAKDTESHRSVPDTERVKIAAVFINGVFQYVVYKKESLISIGIVNRYSQYEYAYHQHDETLVLGMFEAFEETCWNGTMHSFEVYNKALSVSELEAMMISSAIEPDENGRLYSLPSETTFEGTSGQVIDTGVKLFDEPKDFTILMDIATAETYDKNKAIVTCARSSSNQYCGGVIIKTNPWGNTGFYVMGMPSNGGAEICDPIASTERTKIAVVYVGGILSATYCKKASDSNITSVRVLADRAAEQASHDGTTSIGGYLNGADPFVGTVYSCEIYNYAMTSEEVTEKFA